MKELLELVNYIKDLETASLIMGIVLFIGILIVMGICIYSYLENKPATPKQLLFTRITAIVTVLCFILLILICVELSKTKKQLINKMHDEKYINMLSPEDAKAVKAYIVNEKRESLTTEESNSLRKFLIGK